MADGSVTAPERSGLPRRGVQLLHDPLRNKGTAFTEAEREALGLHGLLPPRVLTQDDQVARAVENFRRKSSDLEKYIFLCALQDRNERLFYRTVLENVEEMLPIIYTPTVGEACREFAHIFRRPRGLYVSANDRGRVSSLLRNWYTQKVTVIVVTDGGRILGLGDLGANGMGIPIGKLALYTICAGIDPARCMPVMLDVGTNNSELLADPLYLGIPRKRLPREDYDELVEEFVVAVQECFPGALIQFEDFARENAFRLIETYRNRVTCFNDDIQGTAAVALAGFQAAQRITGEAFRDGRYLFYGAGSAAIGIASLLVSALREEGLTEAAARERIWLFDSRGLVVESRDGLDPVKRPWARPGEAVTELVTAVGDVRPTALVGVSGQGGVFSRHVLEAMGELCERPVIFALSNPTSKAECTAEEAWRATGGRAIFASGSPFGPVEIDGRVLAPGQANNAYIFPGVGLGAVVSGARRITDSMFAAAARALSDEVTDADLGRGSLYPPMTEIRRVSALIAARVADVAQDAGLTTRPLPDDLVTHMASRMFDPHYGPAV